MAIAFFCVFGFVFLWVEVKRGKNLPRLVLFLLRNSRSVKMEYSNADPGS